MPLICLDAEFANGNRMLELAIHDRNGNQLFHEYFKPRDISHWRSDIHHITPRMVRDKQPFSAHVPTIQRIVDNASHIIGFALNNDFEKMEREGITGLPDKPVVELRHWYWMCIGQYENVKYGNGPGLAAVAERFGISFAEGDEHTASGDTQMTLRCFERLLEIFKEKFLTDEQRVLPVEQIVDLFGPIYDREREPFVRQNAHGYCSLIKTPLGYKLKCGTLDPTKTKRDNDSDESKNILVTTIEVNCRHTAELDLRRMLSRRMSRRTPNIYDLRQADIDRFNEYTNIFELQQSEYNHKLLKMHLHI